MHRPTNEPGSRAKNQVSLTYLAGQNSPPPKKKHPNIGMNKSAERHSPWAARSIS